MSKNNKILFLVAILLLLVIVVLLWKPFAGDKKELRDFAIEDTASVTKIFLADKANRQILLERKEGHWMLNDKYEARQDAVDKLLKTMNGLVVKAYVPESAMNTVVKNLAAVSTKVEIYSGENLVKQYYVGNATQDQTGTYMIMEGSSIPFVMQLKGFGGYLTTRYFLEEDLWRSSVIFRSSFPQIKSVEVIHSNPGARSFKAFNYGDNQFGLMSLPDSNMLADFDTVDVKFFLSHFKFMCFDRLLVDMTVEQRDSVKRQTPMHIITLEQQNGEKTRLRTYLKKNPPAPEGSFEDEFPEFSVDDMYALNEDDELLLIQYFVFDPVLKTLDYFLKGNNMSVQGEGLVPDSVNN